jgi:hypothetical protein
MNKLRLISLFTLLVILLTACPGGGGVGKVSGLTATPGAGNITVKWTYTGTDATGFQIWRNPDEDGNAKYGLIDTVTDKTQREYPDNTASDTSKTYKYGVAVVGAGGKVGDRVDQTGAGTKPNPPTVTISLAADKTTIAEGETTTLTATVTGATSVQFFQGTTSLGVDSTAPFTQSVTLGEAGTYTFTAKAGGVTSNAVTVTVTDPGDLAPDGEYQTLKNTPLHAGTPASGIAVIATELAVGGDAGGASEPENGTVTLNTDGTFTYTPDAGFTGEDSFTYSVGADDGTVTITVLDTDVVEASSIADVNGATDGDVIVLAEGSYDCTAGCLVLKDDQVLVGAGSDITVGDLTLSTGTGTTPPTLRNADFGIEVANGVTIKGLRIAAPRIGIQGGDEIGPVGAKVDLTGTLTIENVTITNPAEFGIHFPEADKDSQTGPDIDDDGGLYTINIKNVSITSPGHMGIYLNDAKEISISDTEVTGIVPSATEAFSGQGMRLESERKTKITVENSMVTGGNGIAGPPVRPAVGFYFYKNNAFGNNPDDTGADDLMDVTLNNNTATFTDGAAIATEAVGFRFIIQGPGGDDFEPIDTDGDNGTMSLAGTGNTSNLGGASADFSANTTPPGTANDGVFSGTVTINGSALPSLVSLQRGLLFQ